MNSIIATIFLGATLVAAAPTNFTMEIPQLLPRSEIFDGTMNFFSRYSCTNPCVEDGFCLAGQETTGDLYTGEVAPYNSCFDRPAGAQAAYFDVSNNHKFIAIDKTCEEYTNSGWVAHTYFEGGGKDPYCLVMNHDKIKAITMVW